MPKKIIIILLALMAGINVRAEESKEACIQVITPALNQQGKCQEFSTPCDVPKGWKIVERCPQGAGPSIQWNTPQKLERPINYAGWEDMPFISPDGNRLYFVYHPGKEHTVRPGGRRAFDIYVSERTEAGWREPVLFSPVVNNPSTMRAAQSLSPDLKTIYFGQTTLNNNIDIFVSHQKEGGSWTTPVNLGPNVNSPYQDDTPSISLDGKTLYFYRDVNGQADIYVAKREDINCDTCWQPAQALPSPVNTPWAQMHPHIRPDGKTLYFISNREADPYSCGVDYHPNHIFVSQNNNGIWSQPERLNIPLPNPCAPDDFFGGMGGPSLSADGLSLYFVVNRRNFTDPKDRCTFLTPEGKELAGIDGHTDIWMSTIKR